MGYSNMYMFDVIHPWTVRRYIKVSITSDKLKLICGGWDAHTFLLV